LRLARASTRNSPPDPSRGDSEEASKKKAAIAARIGPGIGWHTFRHNYRSRLDATGAPLKVQHELMRHASITTTINVYGRAMPNTKQEANSKVVSMVLKQEKREPITAAPQVICS